MDGNVRRIAERYEVLAADRWPRVRDFYAGKRDFLLYTWPPSRAWGDIRTPEQAFEANMAAVEAALDVEMDALPYLEPWHGVGIYACSFGCVNQWSDNEASYTRVAFQHIRDALEFKPLRPADNEMMRLVMDSIRYFKSKTGSAVPIVLTDTQTANDTATLVVDASNFMVECVMEPENAHRLLRAINAAIIEFSHVQADAIGDALATPGHIIASAPGVGGISVSDDNQSFCSADFNRQFTNPYNDELGREFGGVAVHSCGNWEHAMTPLTEMEHVMLADCAAHPNCDPCPNDPGAIADALQGSGVAVQMRCPGTREAIDEIIDAAARPGLRLVIKFGWTGSAQSASELYHYATERLERAHAREPATCAKEHCPMDQAAVEKAERADG